MKLLTKITSVFDRVLVLLAIVAAILIVLIMLAVDVAVVMRYFVGRPLIWVVEVAEHALLFITFLGAAWVLKGEGHVKMDLVVNRLKPRTQAILGIISSIIGIVISWALVWYGVRVSWHEFQRGGYTPLLEIPTVFIFPIISIGGFLLFIQFARRARGYLRGVRVPLDKEQGL